MNNKLLTLFLILLAGVSVNATVLLNEHFNQATETLATGDNVSSGSIGDNWTNITGSGNLYMNTSNDLTYAGYKTATDNTNSVEYKATFGKKVAKSFETKNSGSIYVAGILNMTGCEGNSPARDYLWALCDVTSSNVGTASHHYGRLCVQKSDNKFQFGISKVNESAAFISYTEALDYGQYLVVVEYKFVSSSTKNDVIYLYLNPTKGDKPEPTLECRQSYINPNTSADVGSGTKDDPSALQAIVLSNTTGSPAASATKWLLLLDELKVVTDWADLWEEGEEPGGDPEPEPIAKPEPEESDVTVNSATISWDAVANADSYVLQWKVNGGSYCSDIEIDKDVRSYDLANLEENTKYYVRVKTIIGENASEWAEINFDTEAEPATITHDAIIFDKYAITDELPTSGTYYIAKDIILASDVTLTGDLDLCLNGDSIYTGTSHIVVPSGYTLTIYNNKGDGVVFGGVIGSWMGGGVIQIEDGGTLEIREGEIKNIATAGDGSYAIFNKGTLKISGAPALIGEDASVYLGSGKVITIESGKPLTNTTPYSVNAAGTVITSGWANMSGAKPSAHFVSAKSTHRGVALNASGEAELVYVVSLSESSSNSAISSGTYSEQVINVNLTRSLTSSQYNTICLPFALNNSQLEAVFGVDYDLEELTGSSLEDEELVLTFASATSLVAGKPYLLQPSVDVVNPSFEGVTIAATDPVDVETSYVDFHGVYAPTELEGGNKNLLFLGADNTLYWPEATGNLNGFRAYFQVKGAAAKAAKHARIVKQENAATGIKQLSQEPIAKSRKVIRDGQLFILRDGKYYNALGQRIE